MWSFSQELSTLENHTVMIMSAGKFKLHSDHWYQPEFGDRIPHSGNSISEWMTP